MFRKITQTIMIVGGMLVLAACQATESATPTVAPPPAGTLSPDQILTLGDVSDDPAGTIEEFQPMADYLAAHLADFGIRQGKVVVAPDLATMMGYLESGEVDIYFDSPYPALTVYEQIGAHPLVRRWKQGVGEYHAIIVVRQDSEFTDLDSLLGHIIAFDDPVSTSGYLLPKSYLIGNGYQVTEKNTPNDSVAADEIGYVFAGGEENVLAWVLQGKTAGAAIPSSNFEELEADVQSQLAVLARTPDVPRHIALAQPGMDEALRAQIVELLLSLHQTPEGQAILETFESTEKFDALPQGPEGTMKAFQELFAPVR
jgi:phosphonate transport system substrate-binding protein